MISDKLSFAIKQSFRKIGKTYLEKSNQFYKQIDENPIYHGAYLLTTIILPALFMCKEFPMLVRYCSFYVLSFGLINRPLVKLLYNEEE